MKDQLRAIFYWSGMTVDIDDFVKKCDACIKFSRGSTRAPLTTVADESTEPWDVISVDFTGGSQRVQGKILFTVIDHYSRFPFVHVVPQSSATTVIQCLKHLFSTYGFPRVLISDNGTAFTCTEFNDFLVRCGVKHKYSSVYYPESNSTVERFHGTLKSRLDKLLSEGIDFNTALCQVMYDIRSLPNKSIGVSPFERFFSRPMKTLWQGLMKTGFSGAKVSLSDVYERKNKRSRYNLKKFSVGQKVMLRRGPKMKFDLPARIVCARGHGAWLVELNGKQQVYNQKYIKPCFSDGLSARTKESYDALRNFERSGVSVELCADANELGASERNRYFLRPNRKMNYRA